MIAELEVAEGLEMDRMALKFGRVMGQVTAAAILAAASMGLGGCQGFFECAKASCTSTTTTTSSGDYAYVSNSSSGSTYLNGYNVSSGTLVATTSSPYLLGFVPTAMVVSPDNAFLYVASQAGGVYVYTIGTGGALALANSSSPVSSELATSMDISPDGKWFFLLNSVGTSGTPVMSEYSRTISTGVLTAQGSLPLVAYPTSTIAVPTQVKVAPSGNFVVAALGTGGDEIFSFNTSTGALGGTVSNISTGTTTAGDYAVTVDSNNVIYTGRTAAVGVYTATTAGSATQVTSPTSTTISNPHAMAVNSAASFLWLGNETSSTISGFAIASGPKLTEITGSAFAAPTNVAAMGLDNSKNYLVAAGYNATSGVQVFAINSSGVLSVTASAASGTQTTVPVAVAMTH